MKRIGDLREPGAFAGWICAIARRRAVDHYRRLLPSEPLAEAVPSFGPNPSLRAQVTEVLAAIRALPDAYRETLMLRLVEGLSGLEIATVTGLTPDSVRVNLHRGFRLLREKLGLSE
jgi:RNA polymerase sigma-70 factor (ECF subfamily)